MLKGFRNVLSLLAVLVCLAGCVSTPKLVVADRGSKIDYVAILYDIDQVPVSPDF